MGGLYEDTNILAVWEIAAHSVDHMFSLYFDYL